MLIVCPCEECAVVNSSSSAAALITVQPLERALADAAQVGAAQLPERSALEGIKLEIDLELGHVGSKALSKCFVLRDALAGVAGRIAFHVVRLGVDQKRGAAVLPYPIPRIQSARHGLLVREKFTLRVVRL